MTKVRNTAVVAGIAIFCTAFSVFAAPWHGWRGGGGWGMGGAYQRMYNPATVQTVTGTVETVEKITPMRGMSGGIHLLLKTEKGPLSAHLGPEWFIERLQPGIEKGDTVTVTGSMGTVGGKPALFAAEVRKGDETLKLRDERGIPVWTGWRRK